MNKADLYMVRDIKEIFDNGFVDENPRPKYSDGTPAHTLSVNHVVRSYDLSKEFPILSLRKIAWKTGIKELFAIYQNQSNKISEFERLGCQWWQPWSLEDGTIGRSYPYNIESHRPNEMKKTVVKIDRRLVDAEFNKLINPPKFDLIEPIDDKVYFDRYYVIGEDKDYKIINNIEDHNKHKYSKIQFIATGYVTTLRNDDIGRYKGIDLYERTVCGVGYLGNYKNVPNFEDWEINCLYQKWVNILKRCYSKSYKKDNHNYDNIFVHNSWHSFEQFLRDIRFVPQYFLAREEKFIDWHLDKDYYGSNAYSKDTCAFLTNKENVRYARNNGCYKITNLENGKIYYDITLSGFCECSNINKRKLYRTLQKGENTYNNWMIEKVENNKEYVYRYELSRNQVNELIKDIMNDPYGRRHIISFWNWSNIDKKSLVECAYETIWNVRKDKSEKEFLDMALIQRSGDMLAASGAGGINECQYAALQMMIARHTGYEPGIFTHFVANEQIYDRHVSAAKLLLERYEDIRSENEQNPRLILNPDKTNFYDFTIDDFTMEEYNPVPGKVELDLGI